MAEVLKYKVHLTHKQSLNLSKDAKLLTVQEQAGELCLWAEVGGRIISADNSASVDIYMIGTGHDVPEDVVRYICTVQVQTPAQLLVIHIYEGPRS